MIKAKIKTTGQKIVIRPRSHEFYEFVRCNDGSSIPRTLLRRDELEIIGDKQEELIKKACEWLKSNTDWNDEWDNMGRNPNYGMIEEFRKAMEE